MTTLGEDVTTGRRRPGLPRRIAFYIVLGLFVLMLGFMSPLPYVVLGWFLEEIETHRVHETAFGMIFVLSLLGVLAQVRKPENKLAQMWQTAAPVWLVILAVLLVGDPIDPVVLMFLVLPAILVALHPGRSALLKPPTNPSKRLAALAIVAAVPLVVFAVDQFRAGQEAASVAGGVVEQVIEDIPDDTPTEIVDRRIERALRAAGDTPEEDQLALHAGHWSAMAAYAVGIICLAGLATLRLPGWRLPAWGAGLAAAVYGSASLFAPDDASAANTVWAILAIVWGLVFIVAAERVAREQKVAATSEA